MINNRCVVVMEGYFEWKEKSEPYMFKPKNSDHFLVAALYSNDNEVILLTKDATKELEGVHDRMPVILSD
jgi:putative SOS response-associated peptidase YedK